MFFASGQVTHPALPCFWTADRDILLSHTNLSSGSGSSPGRGFFVHSSGGLPPQALSSLMKMATLNQYMSARREAVLSQNNRRKLLDTRDVLQHELLLLAPWDELDEPSQRCSFRHVYECCRLGALIYSNGVILGLPPHRGWHTKLSRLLRGLVESVEAKVWADELSELLIWSLCVGALAAQHSSDRQWYETTLKFAFAMKRLTTWAAVEDILDGYLWCSAACRRCAAVLWASIRVAA
jgi:hypothetical protein